MQYHVKTVRHLILDPGETFLDPGETPFLPSYFPFFLSFFLGLAITTTSNESSGIRSGTGSSEKHQQAIKRTGSAAAGTLSV